jgi:hypothetical protein
MSFPPYHILVKIRDVLPSCSSYARSSSQANPNSPPFNTFPRNSTLRSADRSSSPRTSHLTLRRAAHGWQRHSRPRIRPSYHRCTRNIQCCSTRALRTGAAPLHTPSCALASHHHRRRQPRAPVALLPGKSRPTLPASSPNLVTQTFVLLPLPGNAGYYCQNDIFRLNLA